MTGTIGNRERKIVILIERGRNEGGTKGGVLEGVYSVSDQLKIT